MINMIIGTLIVTFGMILVGYCFTKLMERWDYTVTWKKIVALLLMVLVVVVGNYTVVSAIVGGAYRW